MLNNITMGQYYPTDSAVHRLDPRTKILLTVFFIVGVFMIHSLWGYALALAFVYFMARMSHVPFKMLMKGLKPLRVVLILTFLLNLFFSGEGTPLVHWGFLLITQEGLTRAVHYCLRLIFLVIGTSLLTLTTSPVALSDGLELLLTPLKKLHFPAHELAMMMTIALRFIPTLLDETDKIMKAQMARGADFESGNLFARAKAGYSREDSRRVPVDMVCTLRAGEPVSLTASAGGHVVRAEGPTPEEARNRALTAAELQARLEKTGGTVFRPRETRVELEEGLMLPASAVNALRRQALEGLEAALAQPPVRRTGTPSPLPQAQPGPDAPVLTCSIMRPEQLTEPLAQCETVYVPAELLEKLDLDRWAEMTHICAVLPRIFRTEDQAALRALLQQHREHLSAVAIGNLGHLPIAESLGLPLWGDLGLNLFNSESLLFWKELGLEAAAVSMELRWQQLRDLRKVLPCEAVVYGRLPLMIMENCVIRNELGCRDAGRDYADRSPACRCGQENVLVARTGAQFPLVGQWGHRCEIENSKVLFLADKPEWRQLGLTRARLRFTTEPPEECARVLQAYQGRSDYRPDQLTRGLFYRGVE